MKRKLIAQAIEEVPGFEEVYKKLETSILITGRSKSTLVSYSRNVALISLHFGCSPLELTEDQINEYLVYVLKEKGYSRISFKHTVCGLRYLFKLEGYKDKGISLPSIKSEKKLPVVLSKEECKRMFVTPKLLKHRVLLALVYSAGLRVSEARNLHQSHVDFDRMQLRIVQSKNNKDRYVPLSEMIARGLKNYYKEECPSEWVFNGCKPGKQIGKNTISGIVRKASGEAGIKKRVTSHTLRHTYATHLLEDGLNIVTIKDLMGHSHISTTMIYLHVAQITPLRAFSPLDTLYLSEHEKA